MWYCQCRRWGFGPWVRKIPWRRKRKPPSVFLPEEHHGQRILTGYSPRGHKESDTTEHISTTQKKPEILGKMADSRPTRGKVQVESETSSYTGT